MASGSPWGSVQNSIQLARGVRIVATASHGGIMVSAGLAEKCFSQPALALALRYPGYYCYEEDCLIDVALFELPAIRNLTMSTQSLAEDNGRSGLIRGISAWYPEYLIAIGVNPDAAIYRKFQLRKLRETNIRNQCPNTIRSFAKNPLLTGIHCVITADDSHHFISESSYDEMCKHPEKTLTMYLSDCHLVNESDLPHLVGRYKQYMLHLSSKYLIQIQSDPTSSLLELQGKNYGPRSKFNGCANSYLTIYRRALMDSGISQKLTEAIVDSELFELYEDVDPEFKNVAIFSTFNQSEVLVA